MKVVLQDNLLHYIILNGNNAPIFASSKFLLGISCVSKSFILHVPDVKGPLFAEIFAPQKQVAEGTF